MAYSQGRAIRRRPIMKGRGPPAIVGREVTSSWGLPTRLPFLESYGRGSAIGRLAVLA